MSLINHTVIPVGKTPYRFFKMVVHSHQECISWPTLIINIHINNGDLNRCGVIYHCDFNLQFSDD